MTDTALPLFFSHNHHRLCVQNCTATLDVVELDGRESLSRPFRWDIEFTSADHSLTPQQLLLKPAALVLSAKVAQAWGVPLQQPVRTVQGVVTAFRRLSSSRDETRYALTLQPRLALLRRSRQNAIYQDMSVPQIVEKILRERHNMRGQDFLFDLTREYPRREQVMQFSESDYDFISRLLAEVGIWFRFSTDTRLHIDVVEFFDAQKGYAPEITLSAVAPSGLHDDAVESVWGMQSRHRVVEKSVFTRDYNYRDAAADMDAQVDITAGDETTYGEAYHFAGNYLTAGESRDPLPESGQFYARLSHERYVNDQTRLAGVCNAAALAAGTLLKVTGSTAGEIFSQGVVITALRCRARRDRSLETAFTAMPAGGRYSFRPRLKARPVMAGTLPARVTSTTENDIYGHIDKDGRYRINFLFDRDSWQTGYESLWVRQARPYAGDTYGLHLPLLAGTEVAVAFEDGNPDRPYIIGALHTSTHPDHVNIANYRRNVLRTPTNNKIRIEDNRQKESIKISTENGGKTQLNLGYLVDANRDQRGSGFELRSDSWGALRAGKGIYITADTQSKARGQVLEMAPAVSRLKAAREEMQAISDDARASQASPAELQAQIALMEQKLNELKASVLHLTAPDGVAVTSGEHLQLSAGQNLVATAGNNADISVVKKLFVGVGAQLSVFVRKLGMKLIANQGPVTVQAQNDTMELLARKGISIVSTEDEIQITAAKRITLNAGGSYFTLDAARIELATNGEYNTRAGRYGRKDAASDVKAITTPPGKVGDLFDEQFRITEADKVTPRAGVPYTIRSASGQIWEGITDNDGLTERVFTRTAEKLTLKF
ncbi:MULTISPECIES: type VI secretion system Vgr family protein [Tenebrionibacter/Tenebrionicola group]|uniref:Type VI secretion system tip protein VgrG n=2 Tax=Tenebrionibacter/Tenebrionicola group TaxID=2969848 RepID=A0A8K0V9D2_9ENTR|nr:MULTISPECIES: type VI secretion system tip protein VgrG [Tenebrionibacter/Tenebrionicola group]MBK4716682.1 type VI secretion system tip protein VgrG [Tenebrionibacter intestinalis]MBV5097370.1 type VI secretion system tip protein VgrG [Tenebrionicola larvae]